MNDKCWLILAAVLAGCTIWLTGCAASARLDPGTVPQSPMDEHAETHVAGWSVEGRPIEYRMMGSGGPVILLVGSIHGDEAAGTPLLEALADEIERRPALCLDRRIVLVPAANPDGIARRTRHNANDVDLNRNFPSPTFRPSRRHGANPVSEPETRALMDLLELYPPDRIVSIHQPLACIDYDGPGLSLALAMDAVTKLGVRRLGGRPGSLGSYTGTYLGIPTITLELPGTASRLDQSALLDRYGPALIAAIESPVLRAAK